MILFGCPTPEEESLEDIYGKNDKTWREFLKVGMKYDFKNIC